MPYIKTTWTDRVVANPLTYTLQTNADGTTTLIPAEGTVSQTGTPITAATLNNMEDGISHAVRNDEDGTIGGDLSLNNLIINVSGGVIQNSVDNLTLEAPSGKNIQFNNTLAPLGTANLAFLIPSTSQVFKFTTTGSTDGVTISGSNIQNPYGTGNLSLLSGTGAGFAKLCSYTSNIYLQGSSIYCVAPNTTATYKPCLASAFTVNSARTDKQNIVKAQTGALDKILATSVYDYHLDNELNELTFDEKGNEVSRKPNDPANVKKRKGLIIDEAPADIVFDDGVQGNGIDLYAMQSLIWQAIQELAQRQGGGNPNATTPSNSPNVAKTLAEDYEFRLAEIEGRMSARIMALEARLDEKN